MARTRRRVARNKVHLSLKKPRRAQQGGVGPFLPAALMLTKLKTAGLVAGAAGMGVVAARATAGCTKPPAENPYLLCTLPQMEQLARLLNYKRTDRSERKEGKKAGAIRKTLCGEQDAAGHSRPDVQADLWKKTFDEQCAQHGRICRSDAEAQTGEPVPFSSNFQVCLAEAFDCRSRPNTPAEDTAEQLATEGANAAASVSAAQRKVRPSLSASILPQADDSTPAAIPASRKLRARSRSSSELSAMFDTKTITLEWTPFIVGKANATQYDTYGRIVWNSWEAPSLGGTGDKRSSTEYALTLLDLVYISKSFSPGLLVPPLPHDKLEAGKEAVVQAWGRWLEPLLYQTSLPSVVALTNLDAARRSPGILQHKIDVKKEKFARDHRRSAMYVRYLCALSGPDNYSQMSTFKAAMDPVEGFPEKGIECPMQDQEISKYAGWTNTGLGYAARVTALLAQPYLGVPALLVHPTTEACSMLADVFQKEDDEGGLVDRAGLDDEVATAVDTAKEGAKTWAEQLRDRLCYGCLSQQEVEILKSDWRARWPSEAELAAFAFAFQGDENDYNNPESSHLLENLERQSCEDTTQMSNLLTGMRTWGFLPTDGPLCIMPPRHCPPRPFAFCDAEQALEGAAPTQQHEEASIQAAATSGPAPAAAVLTSSDTASVSDKDQLPSS